MFRLERRACNAAEGFALLFLAWFLVIPVWAFPFARDYRQQVMDTDAWKLKHPYIMAPIITQNVVKWNGDTWNVVTNTNGMMTLQRGTDTITIPESVYRQRQASH